MEHITGHDGREADIAGLFSAVFAASEGDDEGRLIGDLVAELMETTASEDLYVYSAYEADSLVGCIFFTRLTYAQDARTVFMLAPVAVKTDRQKAGVGQKLITFGLDELRNKGVDIVVTYGDPIYYSKVGFAQIREEIAAAPLKLQFPHGWQAQSLTAGTIEPLAGASQCVEAFDNPELW
ncbi:MAG: N-acetyltransferase [Rhizobiaceae bacterium]